MARVMYLDCFSGVAGDMLLAALVDAGLPLAELRAALGSLSVGHAVDVQRVMRAGISAAYLRVRESGSEDTPEGPHEHTHGHPHQHRSLREIAHLIGHSSLSAGGKDRAIALFQRMAAAEAVIHNLPIEKIHLHEVGAVDSIIDIVGVVFAMEWFGIDDVVASPLNVGGGSVEIAHGTYPVPAPATLRLLEGAPVYSSGVAAELVTPTGALLVTHYARAYGPLPPMTVERSGYGAGSHDFARAPNVLRVVVGERAGVPTSGPAGADRVVKIECEIDDMNPQLFGPVSDRLFAAGALDVYLTAVQMKKGRPGTLLTALATDATRAALVDLLFRETTTLGVRFESFWRETLDRRWVDVSVPGGVVRVKLAGRAGEDLTATPEFDDCVRVATATGRPVRAVQAEALQIWKASGDAR